MGAAADGRAGAAGAGAGPAGLAAALAAARAGEDVLVAEQAAEPGGSLEYDPEPVEGQPPREWLAQALVELARHPNVRLVCGATVAGCYDHGVLTIHGTGDAGESWWKVRAGRVVLATGAIEQPLLFGNNDLPGIMLAGAVHRYAARYGVACGRRVIGVVNNDLGWRALLALSRAGVEVVAVIDPRPMPDRALSAAAAERGIALHVGATPLTAHGSRRVRSFDFITADGGRERVECDAIAMSGGFSPTLNLYAQAGGRLRHDPRLASFVPADCRRPVEVVGAAAGITGGAGPIAPAPVASTSQWVDYLYDVTVADVELAVREGFDSIEHLKRYTTVGMGPDQGKTSNRNALALVAALTGRDPGAVGTTTCRPPYQPVTLGAIAGDRRGDFYAPARRLPGHDWHARQGAEFEDFAGWKRPAWYGRDRDAGIAHEVGRVRQAAGLFDASPLGKIEVKGPAAAEFLDFIYLTAVSGLKPGRARYAVMLNENGVVSDDGVCARLTDDHFLVGTSAANAGRVAHWLEEWRQCEWSRRELIVAPVTEQWAVITVAGPRARAIVQALPGMIDLDAGGLAPMSQRAGRLDDGTRYRLQTISFSGEASFELSLPADRAPAVIERLAEIGAPAGLGPIGVEALLVLRLEKGHPIVGIDTDGTTNALDLGFGRIVAGRKTDFVGARSLARPADRSADRRQLVGIEFDPSAAVVAGAHFVTAGAGPRRSEGFVTSAGISPTLGKGIGLGLLEGGHRRRGELVSVFDQGRRATVRVVDRCFYDPGGARIRG